MVAWLGKFLLTVEKYGTVFSSRHSNICCLCLTERNFLFKGFKPYKITHASDHFDKLYNYAVELIKR